MPVATGLRVTLKRLEWMTGKIQKVHYLHLSPVRPLCSLVESVFCGSVDDIKEWRWARMEGSRAEMSYDFAMVTVKLLCLEMK